MAQLPRVPTQNNTQYTLDAQAAAGATSITLNQSVASIVRAPGVCVIDRIDSSGNVTATKREYKRFTGVSGAQLTGVTGGLAGSTDQIHSVGAIVEFVPDVLQEQDWYDWATAEHETGGAHGSLASLTLLRSNQLVLTSLASFRDLYIGDLLNASGASLNALPIRPVWVIPGPVSAASTAVGNPLDMPESGTVEFVSVTLNGPMSSASLVLDINKNFTSIFTDQNTRLGILGGGTFASTASIGTKTFSRSDVFTIDVDNGGGSFKSATVRIQAR